MKWRIEGDPTIQHHVPVARMPPMPIIRSRYLASTLILACAVIVSAALGVAVAAM